MLTVRNYMQQLNKKNFTAAYKQKINSQINDFFSGKIGSEDSSILKGHYINIRDFALRDGKRLRPVISLLAYDAITGKNPDKILLPSISSELLHAGTLIQDDIMDEDSMRRNEPSMHKVMQDVFLSDSQDKNSDGDIFRNKSSRFGVSMAILHGNILFFLGKQAILDADIPHEKKAVAISRYNNACTIVNEGQILDITYALTNQATVEDYIQLVKKKTAGLFIYSAELGAILADSNKEQLKILSECFEKLAIAFQINDDIDDMDLSGKNNSFGSDIKKGNMSLPIIHALNKSGSRQRNKLESLLGKADMNQDDILGILTIIKHTRSLEFSTSMAEKTISQAKNLLDKNKKVFRNTKEIFSLMNEMV